MTESNDTNAVTEMRKIRRLITTVVIVALLIGAYFLMQRQNHQMDKTARDHAQCIVDNASLSSASIDAICGK